MYSQTSSMQKYIVQCYITLQYDDRRRYYLLHTHISQYSSTYLSPILVLPIRSFLRRSQSEVRLCRIIVQFCIKCMVSREESYVSLVRYNNAPFYKTMSRLLQFFIGYQKQGNSVYQKTHGHKQYLQSLSSKYFKLYSIFLNVTQIQILILMTFEKFQTLEKPCFIKFRVFRRIQSCATNFVADNVYMAKNHSFLRQHENFNPFLISITIIFQCWLLLLFLKLQTCF